MNGSTVTSTVLEAPSNHDRPEDKDDLFTDGFIRLPPRTHDISFTDSHISSIERLGADLDAAVKAVWPKRHGIKYAQAHVLLLSWQTDDLRVEGEIVGLQHVFRDRFNFQVESYQIPSLKPDKALKRRVLEFLDFDGKDTLLVVYYGGHARRGLHSNDSPIWFANREDLSISIPSGGIQSLLEEADADVLLLFDCCHSAAVTTKDSLQGKGGVTEVIAACGYETIAAAVDEHSFTKSLTETLAVASKGSPFSVGELHSRVLRKLKCWTPCLERANDGRYIDEPDGRLRLEHQPRRTPIYSIVSESLPRRSIVLAPLPPTTSSPKRYSDSDFESSDSSQAASTPSQSDSSAEPSSSKRKRPVPDDGPCPQILLAIRVERELDLQAFTEWIRNCPPEGRDIHIEGRYDSFSTLLIARMPVAVWNLLPENPAYTFVGFVTSGNQESLLAKNTACECTSRRQCSTCKNGVQSRSLQIGARDHNCNKRENTGSGIETKDSMGRKKLKGKEIGFTERDQAADTFPSRTLKRQTKQEPAHEAPSEPTNIAHSTGHGSTYSAQFSEVEAPNLSRNADSPPTWIDKFKNMSIRRTLPERAAKNDTSESAYTGSSAAQRLALSVSEANKDSLSVTTENQRLGQSYIYDDIAASEVPERATGMQKYKQTGLDNSSKKTNTTPTGSGKLSSSPNASYVASQAPVIDAPSHSPRSQKKPRTGKHSHKSHEHKYEYVWIWTCCSCGYGGMTVTIDYCPEYSCGHTRCNYCPTESRKLPKGR